MIERNDIDGTAAEYVLGTLNSEERAEVSSLRSMNAQLDAAITAWEKRLGPLSEASAEIAPSPELFAKIEKRLRNYAPPDRAILHSQLRHWRALALVASLAFVIVSGFLFHYTQATHAPQFVAVLQKDATTPSFLISLNAGASTLTVHTLSAAPPADKSYELWIIADGSPIARSLGVLPNQDSRTVSLTGFDVAAVRNGTLAVSVEPLGGSPTGKATGPVILTAKFAKATL